MGRRTPMKNHTQKEEGHLAVSCYKCSEGCVHLEYANLMFTFTQQQFLTFSEVISETRRLLLEQREAAAEGTFTASETLVM
jgi:hypothetical protein